MSLLIEGMDMPDLDENAERLWVPGWLEISKDGKAIFCTGTHFDPNTIRSYPIYEVPTPHCTPHLVDMKEYKKITGAKTIEFRSLNPLMEEESTDDEKAD